MVRMAGPGQAGAAPGTGRAPGMGREWAGNGRESAGKAYFAPMPKTRHKTQFTSSLGKMFQLLLNALF